MGGEGFRRGGRVWVSGGSRDGKGASREGGARAKAASETDRGRVFTFGRAAEGGDFAVEFGGGARLEMGLAAEAVGAVLGAAALGEGAGLDGGGLSGRWSGGLPN